MKKKKVAVLMLGAGNASSGGGAQRFFAEFLSHYNTFDLAENELFLIADHDTVSSLKQTGRLDLAQEFVLSFKNQSNRFKLLIERLMIALLIIGNRIDVVQVYNYHPFYSPYLSFLKTLPKPWRPKIVVTIVDCEVPVALEDISHPKHKMYYNRYVPLFDSNLVDGYISWYTSFCEYYQKYHTACPVCFAIDSRFVPDPMIDGNTKKAETKTIVWAARWVEQKRPIFFLKALAIAMQQFPEARENWKVKFLGSGEEEKAIQKFIAENGLDTIVETRFAPFLPDELSSSHVFVSTQDYENFPSLSMMESMAKGNAIICRDVGRSHLLVKNDFNGFRLENDTPECLAENLVKVFRMDDAELKAIGQNSITLLREKHSLEKLIDQFDNFWNQVYN